MKIPKQRRAYVTAGGGIPNLLTMFSDQPLWKRSLFILSVVIGLVLFGMVAVLAVASDGYLKESYHA